DADESVVVQTADIPSNVPAVFHHFRGFLRLAEVAEHAVRAFDEEQSFFSRGHALAGIQIDDLDGDTWQGVPYGARLAACLTICRLLMIGNINSDHGRHLGRSVAFQRAQAEFFAKGCSDRFSQL